MEISDLISQLRDIEDAECFIGPKILSMLAKCLSELNVCDGWLYHKGCNSPGKKRLEGVSILQELLQDALCERGMGNEIPPSAESMLAAYIGALKSGLDRKP